jgi:hypothetical protein
MVRTVKNTRATVFYRQCWNVLYISIDRQQGRSNDDTPIKHKTAVLAVVRSRLVGVERLVLDCSSATILVWSTIVSISIGSDLLVSYRLVLSGIIFWYSLVSYRLVLSLVSYPYYLVLYHVSSSIVPSSPVLSYAVCSE